MLTSVIIGLMRVLSYPLPPSFLIALSYLHLSHEYIAKRKALGQKLFLSYMTVVDRKMGFLKYK